MPDVVEGIIYKCQTVTVMILKDTFAMRVI